MEKELLKAIELLNKTLKVSNKRQEELDQKMSLVYDQNKELMVYIKELENKLSKK